MTKHEAKALAGRWGGRLVDLVAKCGCVKPVPMNDRQLHRCPDHDETFVHPSALKPRKPLRRVSKKREATVRKQGSTLKKGAGFSASREQQEVVRGLPCVFCGKEENEYLTIDPAHLWPRSQGGCGHCDCVIPLCRDRAGEGCHKLFDEGELDLLPSLIDKGYRAELAHPIVEHGISLTPLLQRVTGRKWVPLGDDERAPWDTDEDDPILTHRAMQQDGGFWRAEYRLENGGDWLTLPHRFSVQIGRAETEAAAWAAREGALQVLEREAVSTR